MINALIVTGGCKPTGDTDLVNRLGPARFLRPRRSFFLRHNAGRAGFVADLSG